VLVRIEWEGEAKDVSVAGEFNGWIPIPLAQEETYEDSVWAADISIEPGCYAFKFLVDGEWMTRPDDEIEEDEKGNVNAILIVEEEEESSIEEKNESEVAKGINDVTKIEDDMNILTLNKKENSVSVTDTDVEQIESHEKENLSKKDDEVVSKIDTPIKSDMAVPDFKSPKVEPKFEADKDENEKPKTRGQGMTPKVTTPIIKGKRGKNEKLHPDDVESPRRVTRNLLSKLAPKN